MPPAKAAWSRPAMFSGRHGREASRVKRNPPAAFHHLHPSAGEPAGNSASARSRPCAWRSSLYEGVDIEGETVGLITYMRTDGVQMAREAVTSHPRPCQAGSYGPELPAGGPARIQQQGQERPGSARGGAPDGHRPLPPISAVPRAERRAATAVRVDLEARGRQRRCSRPSWTRSASMSLTALPGRRGH